jgi:iron complex outermembrane receptor protein
MDEAFVRLASLQCKHLVPGYGPVGTCGDIGALARDFSALNHLVETLLEQRMAWPSCTIAAISANMRAGTSIRRCTDNMPITPIFDSRAGSTNKRPPRRCRRVGIFLPGGVRALCALQVLLAAPIAHAQSTTSAQPATPVPLNPVTVTASRSAERLFDVPASVDIIDGATIRDGQPAINLSESLVRVPGVFAANRNNYAQDLQLSSRGYGARATFGVRGVRLYQDDIPATMPDGQGQTGSFSLLSAQRIEVLRGPFSTLYGNASGGVVSVYTEDGTPRPVLDFTGSIGSYRTSNVGLKATGTAGGIGYVAAFNNFDTDGYREHSSALRQIANAKLAFNATDTTRATLIGGSQYQPETQDPLGLTYAQWQANPRQADPVATLFNTRKTINQIQGGAAIHQTLGSDWNLRLTGYSGRRLVRQYLAFRGDGPASSGGVVDLDRDYGGVGLRLLWTGELASRPFTLNIGADTDRQDETRMGFVNNFGSLGDLRRNEDDVVTDQDLYAEAQWHVASWLSLTAGIRSSRVRYSSTDYYVVPPNPDDSGNRTFRNTSPIAGVVWHATDVLNVYFSYGQGFETPTFAELAYRPVGTGLNFDLNATTSTAAELGLKWLPSPTRRVTLAVFKATTHQEIVVNTATGGRTTYRNADETRRRGFEAEWDEELVPGLNVHANYTWLLAEFSQPYVSGIPPAVTPAGARLPGVPPQQAFGVLTWTPGGYYGFSAAAEVQYVGRVYVNDRNTQFAPSYTLGNLRVGFAQEANPVRVTEYVRVNNIANVNYVGSVIVNDTNGRYFEPSPGRNWYAGVSVSVAF